MSIRTYASKNREATGQNP